MKRLLILVLGAALALSAAACDDGGTDTANCVDLTSEGDSFTIIMRGNEFIPSCFTASVSQRLILVNEDSALHSFTVEGTPIDVDIAGDQTLDLDPIEGAVEPGTYELICKYHQPAMTGQITIVE